MAFLLALCLMVALLTLALERLVIALVQAIRSIVEALIRRRSGTAQTH
jgi:hypothetical protein